MLGGIREKPCIDSGVPAEQPPAGPSAGPLREGVGVRATAGRREA